MPVVLPARLRRLEPVDLLLLATLLTASWTKLYVQPFGQVSYTNLLAGLFVVAFLARSLAARELTVPRHVAIAGMLVVAFGVVQLAGFASAVGPTEQLQLVKGLGFWGLHAAFMLCAATHISRGGGELMVLSAATLLAGFAVNAVYGLAQIGLFLGAGANLDALVIGPLTLGQGGTQGVTVHATGVYRLTALMKDPNHLGVTLAAPLLIAAAWLRGWWRAAVVASCAGAGMLTLSRSGMLAVACGLVVLAWPVRHRLASRQALAAGLGAVVLAGGAMTAFAAAFPETADQLVRTRLQVSAGSSGRPQSAQSHVGLYGYVPELLARHPLVGSGTNTFAVHFERITGRPGFGPHSTYIRLLTENGLLGTALYLLLVLWTVGVALAVRHWLAVGVAAAIVATMAGNLFYLTTHIITMEALLALAIASPAALAHAVRTRRSERLRAPLATGAARGAAAHV